MTLGAASMTGKPYNEEFQLPLDGFIHTDCPHYWKFGEKDETEEALKRYMDMHDFLIQGEKKNK